MANELPADLTSLSDDELNSLADSIKDEAGGLQESAATSDEDLARLEQLAKDYAKVVDELGSREAEAQQRNERVQAALNRIGGPAPDGGDDPAADDPAAAASAPTAPDATAPAGDPEPAAEPAAASAATATPPAAAAPAAPAPTAPVAAATIPTDPADGRVPSDPEADPDNPNNPTESEAANVSDTPATLPSTPDPVAALSANAPATATATLPAPRQATPFERGEVIEFVDNGAVTAATKDTKIENRRALAELICKKHSQLVRLSANVPMEPIAIATATAPWLEEDRLTPDAHEKNFGLIRKAVERGKALVASGANCAPLTPNYDVFDVAEAMSPVEGALTTVPAPRGGVRYVQPPLWPQAQAGVRFTTAAQEAAGYTNQDPAGTTAPKPCVHMTCRSIVECSVDAISQCVTFGNLQYRTFPELVEVFLNHLAVAYAQAKEINYLDTIEAGSTTVNYTPAYGATRGAVFAYTLAAHAYRKRNHMPLDAPLDILAPDSLVPVLRADMVNDLHLGLSFLQTDEVGVAREMFNRLNLNVTWYYDFSTDYGSTRAMQQSQSGGVLNGFPTLFRNYMFAPGTWVRLDGGTLDIGIVRDSTLNSQNDLQMFSEEWTQVCKAGSESVRLDLTLCPDGTGPTPAAALACAS